MAQINENKEMQELLDKALPVMNPEQQAEALASFCSSEAHEAFIAECEAREARLYQEANELFTRAKNGERVVLHPIYHEIPQRFKVTEELPEVSFHSHYGWVGYNGARCMIANAFSLQMLMDGEHEVHIKYCPENVVPKDVATSYVGHADTAAVLGVLCNRGNLKLRKGDILFVAQLVGGRLPEGCTTLPEGFQIKWYYVTVD